MESVRDCEGFDDRCVRRKCAGSFRAPRRRPTRVCFAWDMSKTPHQPSIAFGRQGLVPQVVRYCQFRVAGVESSSPQNKHAGGSLRSTPGTHKVKWLAALASSLTLGRSLLFNLLAVCWLTFPVIEGHAQQVGDGASGDSASSELLMQAARDSFRAGDVEHAHAQLVKLLGLYRAEQTSEPGWLGEYQWSRQLAEVASEYLRGGQLNDALAVLGEAAELDVPLRKGFDNGLASAAGGLHRRLMALDSNERYALLHEWSMPTESRQTVRVLATFVPSQAPPPVFARALGERPRSSSFQIASVSDVTGLFSTAWELVKAADEVGRLRRLIAELEALAEQNAANAEHVLTLARIVAASRHDEELAGNLRERVSQLRDGQPATSQQESGFENAWQYGFGYLDPFDQQIRDFTPLPVWSGAAWQFSPDRPHAVRRFLRLDRNGGHPGPETACVRRWTAPADGVLSITGTLDHPAEVGDGVRARLVSSRAGLCAEWIAHKNATSTNAESMDVEAGDTIDFVVDKIETTGHDTFTWKVQLRLTASDGAEQLYDSAVDFCGPNDKQVLAVTVVAAACLEQTWLASIAEDLFEKLIENTYDTDTWSELVRESESPYLRPVLQRAWATAARKRAGSSAEVAHDSDLKWWVAASRLSSRHDRRDPVHASWLSHEDHILHLAGCGNDFLFFKYPLTGDFEFSCEAQFGGRPATDGGVAYSGRLFDVSGSTKQLMISDLQADSQVVLPCQPVRIGARLGGQYIGQPRFNRITLSSVGDQLTYLCNGQPIWSDAQHPSAPWLALQTRGDRRPMFRNLRLTGNPVVPREVRLADGDSLRGWFSADDNWSAEGGIIHGARLEAENAVPTQSCLRYLRPLLDGESIGYEFLYQAGESEVHPALGRLAFLIEPEGVRLHWITDPNGEWTGLAEDNAVVEPFDRRGLKPLPLVRREWNQVAMSIAGEHVTLSLNSQVIYQRKLNHRDERTFGLYHDAARTAARVRNMVMRGDWPERLTAEHFNGLTAAADPDRSRADRHALAHILRDKYLSQNSLEITRRSASLAGAERYELLASWVLPGEDHPTIRAVGTFAPLQPPPISDLFAPPSNNGNRSRVSTGAHVVAPALELVAVAKELGQLNELRRRVVSIPVSSEDGTVDPSLLRSREALLTLIEVSDDNWDAANEHLARLLEVNSKDPSLHERWPEMLAVDRALRHRETFESARELAGSFYGQLTKGYKNSDSEASDRHMWALGGRTVVHPDVEVLPRADRSQIQQWVPVSTYTARSRGLGFPQSRWRLSPKQFDHLAGHDSDFVYFQSPLRGSFQVDCEVTSFSWRETNLAVAGTWVEPYHDHSKYLFGRLRDAREHGSKGDIEPPLTQVHSWIHYRIDVRDGRLKAFFNGRNVHTQELPQQHNPWLAVRSSWLFNGSVRDLRITGDPVVPPQVRLAETDELSGWVPYFEESVGREDGKAGWHFAEGELQGRRDTELSGGSVESLLQHHRPMLEDGTIEYEFYYAPETTHVHPAMDRIAFLLEPAGVRIHWVTDGSYDRTDLDPGNSFEEPQHRRGPARLPLKPNEWNHLRLVLAGDIVTISLNETLVYERELEPTNMRTFGLFRYANQTAARVRSIVWRGDWPRELPPLDQQELADVDLVASIDARIPELSATFDHDFSEPWPRGWLGMLAEHPSIHVEADGLHIERECPGDDRYCQISSLFRIVGDFDVTASFDELDTEIVNKPGTGAHVSLSTSFLTPDRDQVHIVRNEHHGGDQKLDTGHHRNRVGGERVGPWKDYVHDGPAGTFRIARRGETLYLLFADGDSNQFRLLDQYTIPAADVDVDGLRLTTQVFGKGGTINVVWKKLTVRAEALQSTGSVLAATLRPDKNRNVARFLRVELRGPSRMLSLAEVQVFSDDRNVAEGRPAKQSSTGWDGFAKLAVDGITNGHYYAARSTTHTEREEDPWWEVDLGKSYNIDRVLIWNRSDFGGERLRGFSIQLLDEKRNVVWEEKPRLRPETRQLD